MNFMLYSSLHNRVSKILPLNVGFVLKLTVLYFIGISKISNLFVVRSLFCIRISECIGWSKCIEKNIRKFKFSKKFVGTLTKELPIKTTL